MFIYAVSIKELIEQMRANLNSCRLFFQSRISQRCLGFASCSLGRYKVWKPNFKGGSRGIPRVGDFFQIGISLMSGVCLILTGSLYSITKSNLNWGSH